ncbi:MAG: energy transducer TonB [Bacteroidetes bacterium]|nr:energy transducer TonB [Bacteroidota bacterium]
MAKNSENNITSSGDFLRYRNGEMTGEERNAYERKLQKDPFAEEASEGISSISAEDAESDLSELKKKLGTRIRKRSFAIYYQIAAAAAILVTVSVIFLKRNTETEIMLSKSETVMPDTTVSIAAAEPIKDLSEKTELKNEPVKRYRQVSPPPPVSPSPSLPVSPSPNLSDNQLSAVSSDAKEEIREEKADVVSAVEEEQAVTLPSESEKKMEKSGVAGASAPLSAKRKDVADHFPPQPVKIVILSFNVNTNSTITDYRIIESPGPAYSREAKRLIKEGPLWKPALNNGQPAEEEYRIRIVFRKSE